MKRHEAFLRARGRHYSNEAEAMKVSHSLSKCPIIIEYWLDLFQRAQQLLAQEDEEEDAGDSKEDPEEDIEAAFDDDDGPDAVITRIPGQAGVPPLPNGPNAPKLNGIGHGSRPS